MSASAADNGAVSERPGVQHALFNGTAGAGALLAPPRKPRRQPRQVGTRVRVPEAGQQELASTVNVWVNLKSATLRQEVVSALSRAKGVAAHESSSIPGKLEVCRLSALDAPNPDERLRIAIAPAGRGSVNEAIRLGAWGYVEYSKDPLRIDAGWLEKVVAGVARGEYAVLSSITSPEEAVPLFIPHARECPLTEQERKAVLLAAEGLSNAEISARLKCQEQTVKNSFTRIYKKLDTPESRMGAIRKGVQQGWVGMHGEIGGDSP